MMHKVANAAPWPQMQRFDYLVRSRVLSESEVQAYRLAFASSDSSPYRHAAQVALWRMN